MNPPRFNSRFAIYWALILLLPLLVLWRRDDPLYSPPWQSDPWFYLGYFHNLVNFKRDLFPSFYYGTRLSWILPGYLLHWMFPAIAANAIMHLGAHTVASGSLFRILRSTAGVRAAFLTAIFFSAYPWLWAVTGWDHVTGGAIAYLLLGMACLTAAAETPGRRWLLASAGASLTAAMVAHLFLAALVPLVLLHYAGMVWARRDPLKPALGYAAIWLSAGFLSVIAPLCAINGFLIDGNFWFWSPSFRTAGAVMNNYIWSESIWRDGRLDAWLWFLIPSALVALVIVCRWRPKAGRRDLAGTMVSAQLLLALAFLAVLQARGITLLGHFYYACYLFPFAFLVIGNSFWRSADKMTARTYAVACAFAMLLAAAVWYDPAGHPAKGEPAWLIGAFGALAASLALRKRLAAAFVAIAGFAVLIFATYDGAIFFAPLHATRSQYRSVTDTRQRIEKLRVGSPILFWYDREEPAYYEYCALNATYMAEFARISETFPSGCPEPARRGTIVVVPSAREDAAEIARAALNRCWSGTGFKAGVNDTFAAGAAPHPYTVDLLASETDYSVQRPLHATFDLRGKSGNLRLAPDPNRDDALPPHVWVPVPDAEQSFTRGGIEVRTPANRYAYALTYPALVVPADGCYRFVLRYSLRSGQFAFGAFPADQSRWLASVPSGPLFGAHREAAFFVDLHRGDTVILRIANNNTEDRPSSFTIEGAMAYLFAPAR